MHCCTSCCFVCLEPCDVRACSRCTLCAHDACLATAVLRVHTDGSCGVCGGTLRGAPRDVAYAQTAFALLFCAVAYALCMLCAHAALVVAFAVVSSVAVASSALAWTLAYHTLRAHPRHFW